MRDETCRSSVLGFRIPWTALGQHAAEQRLTEFPAVVLALLSIGADVRVLIHEPQESPSGPRGAGCVKEQLHRDEVEPAAELVGDLVVMSDLDEAESLMKSNRTAVLGIDAADHHMYAGGPCPRQQRLNQGTAYAAASVISMHVHRMLDRIAIAPARPPWTIRRESHGATVLIRNQHGKSFRGALTEPGGALLKSREDLIVDRGRLGDDLVEDLKNGGKVRRYGVANNHVLSPLKYPLDEK